MPQAIFAYHLGMDAEQYAFFRIPKLLITEPYFRRLSTDAKLLYGLMLDRMSLSIKNRWLISLRKKMTEDIRMKKFLQI